MFDQLFRFQISAFSLAPFIGWCEGDQSYDGIKNLKIHLSSKKNIDHKAKWKEQVLTYVGFK